MKKIISAPDLTVLQPWATPIVLGLKDVENRSGPVPKGFTGTAFIHAGKSDRLIKMLSPRETGPDGEHTEGYLDSITGRIMTFYHGKGGRETLSLWKGQVFLYGHIIGTVDIVGCSISNPSEWAQHGMYHWELDNARPCVPIPHRGHQGFWPNKPITREVEWL